MSVQTQEYADLSHNERCALRLALLCEKHNKPINPYTLFKGRDADDIPYSFLLTKLVEKGYLKGRV